MLGELFCGIGKAFGGCPVLTEPVLKPYGTIDLNEMSSIILDKMEEMGDTSAEIYLPDEHCVIYKEADVVNFLKLDRTDKIKYVPELYDCDDFAAEVYGLGLSLVWTNLHALNYFVDENRVLWFVEPQQDKIAPTLDHWQGWRARFFLAR